MLEAVQGRVDRAFGDVKGIAAAAAELFDHGVPVCWAGGEDGQEQPVEVVANRNIHT
jgi:hypothetical protein